MNKFYKQLDEFFKEAYSLLEENVKNYKKAIEQQLITTAHQIFGPNKIEYESLSDGVMINVMGTLEDKAKELGADNFRPANKHLIFIDKVMKEIK